VDFEAVIFSLRAGWFGMLGGVLSGAFVQQRNRNFRQHLRQRVKRKRRPAA
jgi:hypothetical protein